MFPIIVDSSLNPLRSFRRLARIVLLVSFIPNVGELLKGSGGVDLGMLALMVLHLVAWAVVNMLTVTAHRNQVQNHQCERSQVHAAAAFRSSPTLGIKETAHDPGKPTECRSGFKDESTIIGNIEFGGRQRDRCRNSWLTRGQD